MYGVEQNWYARTFASSFNCSSTSTTTKGIRMAKKSRTELRSSAGKKLYAVRDEAGKFEDIQSFQKSHAQDIKSVSQDELKKKSVAQSKKAAVKPAPKPAPKAAEKVVKKAAPKKVVAKVAATPVAKPTPSKPAAKTVAKKTASKVVAKKSAVKKTTVKKTTVKKPAAKKKS
jgi:DNA-binding protein HU-beta